MKLRKHQAEMNQIIDDIISGQPIKHIIVNVTPGGGKSMLPIIAGRLIAAGLADALCWIVPRQALQRQGESNFQDRSFRESLEHTLSVRSSTNDIDPCRGLDGFVTTYQAIGEDEHGTVLRELLSKRYVLVFDEFHHAEENSPWHVALQSLFGAASYTILMTGTLERGNGGKIAFVPYFDHGLCLLCGFQIPIHK